MSDLLDEVRRVLATATGLPEAERIALYNGVVQAAASLVADVTTDPAIAPNLVEAGCIVANDYNPNTVASPELDLLERSMLADGITMPIVVVPDGDRFVIVDGFHRRTVGATRLGRRYLPCSVISRPLGDRMASTVRHNRARGKHQVDLMASLVKSMMAEGWDDDRVARGLGMSVEELLRLRQMVGAARFLAAPEYGRAWERPGGPNTADE